MPAASGSDLVPDINDVDPDDDMDVDSEDDASLLRFPGLPSAGGQPQTRLVAPVGADRAQRAGHQGGAAQPPAPVAGDVAYAAQLRGVAAGLQRQAEGAASSAPAPPQPPATAQQPQVQSQQ
eukprot:104133-Alexandrium_andersonii.AAC.1